MGFHVKSYLLACLVALSVLLTSPTVQAGPIDNAASDWAERVADGNANDFLRDIEGDIPIDPSARNAVKGAIKSFISRQLQEQLISGEITQAMASILQAIGRSVGGHRARSRCQRAAAHVASSAFTIDRTSYSIRGMANAYPGILTSAAGAPGILRNVGAAILGKVRSDLEAALDRYIDDYRIETFSETWSFGLDCAVTVKVVWLKHAGQFQFLLIGDCNCAEISTPRGESVRLSRWSVTGRGTAGWVGEAAERANARRVDPRSALSGRPFVSQRSINVRAICCDQNGRPERTPGLQPWNFDPVPTPARQQSGVGRRQTGCEPAGREQTAEPEEPVTRTDAEVLEERRGIQDPTSTIPEIPEGPVSPETRDRLVRQAFDAWQTARDRRDMAQADLERLEGDIKDGEAVTEEQMQQAREAVEQAEQREAAAREARQAAEQLETTDQPTQQSGLGPMPDATDCYAIAVQVPERCVGTWHYFGSGQGESVSYVSISYPEFTFFEPQDGLSQQPGIPVCADPPPAPDLPIPGSPAQPAGAPPQPPSNATPPTETTEAPEEPQVPSETEGSEPPDLGLVKAAEQVVELALSRLDNGQAITQATVKLLAPFPELPTGASSDPELTSAENYEADVPAAKVNESGTLKLSMAVSDGSGETAELALVEPELELVTDETEPRQSDHSPAAAPTQKRRIAIETAPAQQVIVAGNRPMTSLPSSLLPAASKICINRGFRIGQTPVFVLSVPEPEIETFADQVKSSEAISFFEPDACREKELNDPHFQGNGLWGQDFDNQWAIKRANIKEGGVLQEATPNTLEVTVAVIDTGIDWHHPDLPHSKLWRNPGETPGNGIDDDGNGYVDDVVGWNFVHPAQLPWDYDGHGTFVAGVIAAGQDNGVGIAGINPHARIMVLKALDAFGRGHASRIAEAIAYAADNGAEVINLSLGGRGLTNVERLAVEYAYSQGAIVVVASGNDGKDVGEYSPAALPGVITVVATDRRDRRAKFSNWGAEVDIAAPGVDVLSLRARRTDLLSFIEGVKYEKGKGIVGDDRAYYRASGTSFATPIVAGTISLLLSRRPDLTTEQAARMVLQSARDIETPGIDNFTGYGLVDAEAALDANPDYFLESRIHDVKVVGSESLALRVIATTDANEFAGAEIMLGRGDQPNKWLRVNKTFTKQVRQAPMVDLPAKFFSGSRTWTIRLVTRHKNGTTREARFKVTLG